VGGCESIGLSSSVGIATDYGLDNTGSNPGGDEIFSLSRPALGPTQPPVQWVPVLSWGRGSRGVGLNPSPPSSIKGPRKEYSYTCTHPKGLRGL